MARKVTQLPTRSKRNTTSNDVLLLSNKETSKNFQIPITEVFPKLNNGALVGASSNTQALQSIGTSTQLFVGGGSADTTTGVDNNTLVFRGFRIETAGQSKAAAALNHNSTICPLQLFVETSTAAAKGNILLGWDASAYGLSNFSNDSSFLTTVNLASNVTGALGVTNGGTGLTSVAAGSVLVATSSNTIAAATPSGNGKVLISNASTGYPAWATLTAGTNVTISESAGGITIASAIGTISSTLDTSNNDIDLGTGWLSGDGTDEGINLNSAGKVFVGSSTPTSYFTSDLNVNSSISLGNTSGSSAQTISMKSCTTGASPALAVAGANASGTGNKGGDVLITPGTGDTNGNGGDLFLSGGAKAGSGTNGSVKLKTAATDALVVDANQDVTVSAGSLIVTAATEGIVHTGSGTVTQASNHTTAVTLNATSGVIQLAAVGLSAATNAEFTVTNSTVQADSVIILTVQDENTTNNAQLTACTHTITGGSFKISVFNPAATGATSATASKIHFLIINNSV
ncbi:hypothetical protein OAA26_00215 [bacterium]|nr:hypothetical protein [bacterium]|tara:strand:- start:876 stop:2423 length:1548 start_codon:yes stop_codon:yes gene_type:complete